MKTTIFHRTLLFATAVLTFAACNTPGDKFDYDYKDFNVAYMSGTDTDPLRKFVVEDTPVSDNVSVMLAAPAEKDVTVKVAIDLSKSSVLFNRT